MQQARLFSEIGRQALQRGVRDAIACRKLTRRFAGHDRPTHFATIYRIDVIARTEPQLRRSASA